jgi:hypothetical protein
MLSESHRFSDDFARRGIPPTEAQSAAGTYARRGPVVCPPRVLAVLCAAHDARGWIMDVRVAQLQGFPVVGSRLARRQGIRMFFPFSELHPRLSHMTLIPIATREV